MEMSEFFKESPLDCKACGEKFAPTASQIKHHNRECKSCTRARHKVWRAKRKASGNPVVSGKMSREYHREYEKQYKASPEVRKRYAELSLKYRTDGRLRYKYEVRQLTHSAIQRGRLIRKPCEKCGNEKTDAHHDNYSKPLDVRWLCRPHHAEFHKQQRTR